MRFPSIGMPNRETLSTFASGAANWGSWALGGLNTKVSSAWNSVRSHSGTFSAGVRDFAWNNKTAVFLVSATAGLTWALTRHYYKQPRPDGDKSAATSKPDSAGFAAVKKEHEELVRAKEALERENLELRGEPDAARRITVLQIRNGNLTIELNQAGKELAVEKTRVVSLTQELSSQAAKIAAAPVASEVNRADSKPQVVVEEDE